MRILIFISLLLTFSLSGFAQQAENPTSFQPDTTMYSVCEKMPEFPGGGIAFISFISQNFIYPSNKEEYGFIGSVYFQFIVETDGTLSNIVIRKTLNPDLDAEVLRIIKLMPKWIPGEQAGKKVRCLYTVPLKF